ncbi:MAG: hypothetical protein ACNA8W_23490, partial [Bradymonadaceae bacterium]
SNPFAHNAPTGVRNEAVGPVPKRDRQSTAPAPAQVDAPLFPGTDHDYGSILERARALYESGDFEPALELINALLADVQDSEALQLQAILEGELERVQHERIGALGRVPSLAVNMNVLAQLNLDHRAGFILSQIDGMMCFEDIIDMSSMSRLETMTLLAELCDRGIIVAN